MSSAKAISREEFTKVQDAQEELRERIERLTIRVEVFANDLHKLTQQVGDVAEDLVAIRAEMNERLERLEAELGVLTSDVGTLKADVTNLKTDVAVLKLDVAVLKLDVSKLKEDVAALKEDVAALKQDVRDIKQELSTLKTDMAAGFAQVLAAIAARPS